MKILAIDPGNVQSAYVIWNTEKNNIYSMGKIDNPELFDIITNTYYYDEAVIEMIASYGMGVGKSVFETVLWIGRYYQKIQDNAKPVQLVYRSEIKMHHCHIMKAKDGNIRQALIDRFGEPGVKKSPGKLYGVKADIWQALALAVYYADTNTGGDKHGDKL